MLDWFRFVLTAVLMLAGLFVLLVGVVSQYRFRYVLNRMHAASMGDSLGMLLVLTGLCISQNDGWVILKYLLTALPVADQPHRQPSDRAPGADHQRTS